METVFQILAICLLVAVLAAMLKKQTPELALLLAIAAVIAVLMVLADALQDITALIECLLSAGGLPSELFLPLLKTAAIALIGKITGDLCRDAGQSAIASLVDIACAFGVIVVSLPLFEAVWEILQTLI